MLLIVQWTMLSHVVTSLADLKTIEINKTFKIVEKYGKLDLYDLPQYFLHLLQYFPLTVVNIYRQPPCCIIVYDIQYHKYGK